MIPFCPDCMIWRTERDEVVTLADLLADSGWNGTHLYITGSQENDYSGVSSLFTVTMHRDLAVKYFGSCRVFDTTLHNIGEVNVADKHHFFAWVADNGIQQWEDVQARYEEYRRAFPMNCINAQSRIRISV